MLGVKTLLVMRATHSSHPEGSPEFCPPRCSPTQQLRGVSCMWLSSTTPLTCSPAWDAHLWPCSSWLTQDCDIQATNTVTSRQPAPAMAVCAESPGPRLVFKAAPRGQGPHEGLSCPHPAEDLWLGSEPRPRPWRDEGQWCGHDHLPMQSSARGTPKSSPTAFQSRAQPGCQRAESPSLVATHWHSRGPDILK